MIYQSGLNFVQETSCQDERRMTPSLKREWKALKLKSDRYKFINKIYLFLKTGKLIQ